MTIENLKQIAIKYASTKGSRIPLAPDELCNAVVQYMNSFFSVMTDINTIKVAVTEDSGNIVFTITGNTYDGKPITPIVITVDHNDFVTDQEFEEFKTNILDSIDSLNNSITEINNTIKNINDTLENNTTDITGLKNRVDNTETNIAEINSTLDNKVDKITDESTYSRVYAIRTNGEQFIINETPDILQNSLVARDDNGRARIGKGVLGKEIANMENIADVEAKIPEYTNVDSVSYDSTNGAIVAYDGANEIHIPLLAGENVTIDASEDNKKIVISAAGGGGAGDVTAAGNNIFTGENEFRNYTYATSNFCFVVTKEDYLTNGYTTTIKNGGFDISYYENGEGKYWTTYADNSIINKDIDMESEVVIKFPKKEGTFALTSDIPDTSSFVTLAGNNTFTGVNTFNNSIYAKNGVVAGDTTNYGANSVTKGSNTYSFPNKSGTFAMTTDVIKTPIYFISFYANVPSEPCHLIGTMMSKNSYGTGQKTNEEFAVMLADNLYTNSNEGLAAYGRLAEKDILCIYSEDGLSIRCLNEENSEVDLPTVMFFVMETEL